MVIELARWGAPLLPELDDTAEFQPSLQLLTLDARRERAGTGDQETAVRSYSKRFTADAFGCRRVGPRARSAAP